MKFYVYKLRTAPDGKTLSTGPKPIVVKADRASITDHGDLVFFEDRPSLNMTTAGLAVAAFAVGTWHSFTNKKPKAEADTT